jgi:hypothetical protein
MQVRYVVVNFKIAKCILGEVRSSWNKYTVPRRRQEDNIRRNLKEIGWEGVDRVDLAQDRDKWWALVNTAMNVLVP